MPGGYGVPEQAIFRLKNQSGAIDRSAYDKMADWISVKDYGARGDGISDDTIAIGNAIADAAGTQLLNFPFPGPYISSTYGTVTGGVYYPPLMGTNVLRPVADKLLDTVSVKDFGAKGDGTTDDTAAIQTALTSGLGRLSVPDGTYKITSTLDLPTFTANMILEFSAGAKFIAGANNIIFFRSLVSCYLMQILDANLDGNGHTGVTGFDLISFRAKAALINPNMTAMANGIILRQLCWDLIIDNPRTTSVTFPLIMKDGSNVVDVRHPAFDTYTTGIQIINGPTYDVLGIKITGGFIQNGTDGIVDTNALSTYIDGTYFEGNTGSDVSLSGSILSQVQRTQHWISTGTAAIKGRNTTGVTIFGPSMGSGGRSLGLYDFDTSNTNAVEWHPTDSVGSKNLPLGTVTGLSSMVAQTTATFTPTVKGSTTAGTGTYSVQSGKYTRTGNLVSFHIELTWSAHTGTGNTVIAGLPTTLTPANFTPRRIVQIVPRIPYTGPVVYAYLNGSTTDLTLVQIDTAGTGSLIALPGTGTLFVGGTYEL